MTRQELERWLCGPDAPDPTPAEIAALLGLPLDDVRDSTLLRVADRLRGVRFTVAVLRDVFADDHGVRRWLRARRPELGGLSAVELLVAGRSRPVEELAMGEWHRPPGVACGAACDPGTHRAGPPAVALR